MAHVLHFATTSITPQPPHRVLSTTTGLDTTLLTINYALVLLHSQLDALSTHRLSVAANALVEKASTTLLPGETLIAALAAAPSSRLVRTSKSLRALADLIADFRIFLRLWGLLGIWSWGAATWREPPQDRVLRAVAWAQVLANAVYQAMENAAYLGSHGVLRMSEATQNRWYAVSSRFWMAHVVLDFGRLARMRQLRHRRGDRVGVEKEERDGAGKVQMVKEEAKWWSEAYVNAAYAPLTVHWSLEQGCLSEAWVGFLGTIAGLVGFKERWQETA